MERGACFFWVFERSSGDDAGGERGSPEDLVVGVVEIGARGCGVVVAGDTGDKVELEGGFEVGCEGAPVEDEFARTGFVEVDEFFLFEGFELPELGFERTREVEASKSHGQAAFGGVAQGGGESDGFAHACAAFVEFGLQSERDSFARVWRESIILEIKSKGDIAGAFEAEGEGVFAGSKGFAKVGELDGSQLALGEALLFECLSVEESGDLAVAGFGGESVLVGHDGAKGEDGGLCCAVSTEALVGEHPLDGALEGGFWERRGFEHGEDGKSRGFDVKVVSRRRGDGEATSSEAAIRGLCVDKSAEESSGFGVLGSADFESGGRSKSEQVGILFSFGTLCELVDVLEFGAEVVVVGFGTGEGDVSIGDIARCAAKGVESAGVSLVAALVGAFGA